MIPFHRASSRPVAGPFVNSVEPLAPLHDVELGGRNLNDATGGLLVKPWHLTYDRTSGEVRVSAEGSPTTVLFVRPNISQLSLAFDRNMQPCVAFVQAGQAKFYFYDDLLPGFVFWETELGSAVTPRCTHDDKRSTQSAVADVVLAYVRGGAIYYREQRDRFLVERFFVSGATALLAVGMNIHNRLQFRYKGAGTPDAPFLGEVVEALCQRAGLAPGQYDTRDLWVDRVPGLMVDGDDGLATVIDELRAVFPFDKSDHSGKLHFPMRGGPVVARIPYRHLVKRTGATLEQELVDETALAREITLEHLDPDGGFAKNKQFAQRRSNLVKATGKRRLDTRVVLTVDQAASACERLLRAEWNEQITYKFTTTIAYAHLTVADVVEVEDRTGAWHRVRLDERNEDSVIEWEATQDGGPDTYGVTRHGNQVPPPTSTTPGLVGDTVLEIIDVSPLQGSDDELGLYVGAYGSGSGWAGWRLLVSNDGGNSFQEAMRSTGGCTAGETTTDLVATLGYQQPAATTVRVLTNYPLASVTNDQLLLQHNRALIGDEVVQYLTATLLGMVDSRYHYQLTGLVRGVQATDVEHWPAGARFVVLDDGVVFLPVDRTLLGTTVVYKAVSNGQVEDEAMPVHYPYTTARSQTEWAPADVLATRASGNVTVTWAAVARLGTDTAPYHSKYFAGSRVKFSNGHTIDVPAGTTAATYPSAPAGVTVQVCQLNSITGEGPYSPAIAT